MSFLDRLRRTATLPTVEFNRQFLIDQFLPAPKKVVLQRLQRLGILVAALGMLWLLGLAGAHLVLWLEDGDSDSRWFVEPTEGTVGLVVLTHGWTRKTSDLEDLAQVIRGARGYDHHAIYLYGYDSRRLSNGDPRRVSVDLADRIKELRRQVPTGEVLLAGHSVGGLLLRRAYLHGWQDYDDFRDQGRLRPEQEWPLAVERMFLLATPNRGSRAVFRSTRLWLIDALSRSWGVGGFIRRTYYGSPFVVNLRIDWIRRLSQLSSVPRTVQFLGEEDQYVGRGDSRDVLALGADEILVPGARHRQILQRRYIEPYLQRELELGSRVASQRTAVSAAQKVLLVHGIRDYGDRFDRIGKAVQEYGQGETVLVASPTYGYFSALQFLNPGSRRLKLLEFADLYAEMMARTPVDAPIHYVGHSFGTYLLGAALEEYDSIRFENVYLAGSVLAQDYDWKSKFRHRIGYVRNDRSHLDWPVGILCAAMADLGMAPLIGTGGYNGFTKVAETDPFYDVAYFQGGHGKPLEQKNHTSIAGFLLTAGRATGGYDPSAAKESLESAKMVGATYAKWLKLVSRMASGLILLVLAPLLYLVTVGRHPIFAGAQIVLILWLFNII